MQGRSAQTQNVTPAMMYRAETWAVQNAQEKTLNVVEMSMCGVTKMDRIRNERRYDKYTRKCRKEGSSGTDVS